MTFLLTLIIAITLGELFKRIFKSKILGFLVTFALCWIYGEISKGKTILDILTAMISLLAFLVAAFIVALKVFVKKLVPGAILSLEYCYCEIKRVQDFDYDPLSHLIESLNIDAMLQIMFKAKKISTKVIEKLRIKLKPEAPYTNEVLRKLSLPCFRVLLRLVAFFWDFREEGVC